MNISTTKCSACKQVLPLSSFCKNKRNKKTGHDWQCKSCVKAYQSTIKDKLQAYQKEYQKTYVVEHREERLATAKKWYKNNTARAKQTAAEWHKKHPDQAKLSMREWHKRRRLKKLNEQQSTS